MCVDLVEVGPEHAQIEQDGLLEFDSLEYCPTQFFQSSDENLVHWPGSKSNINHFVGELLVNSELRKVGRHQALLIPDEQVLPVAPRSLNFLFKL